MKSCDRLPIFLKYEKDFEIDIKTGSVKIKDTASKKVIQAYFREQADFKCDSNVLQNAEKLSNFMIDEFKKTECYNSKSEKEKKEIIQYLKDNPEVENNVIYDEKGNAIPGSSIRILK